MARPTVANKSFIIIRRSPAGRSHGRQAKSPESGNSPINRCRPLLLLVLAALLPLVVLSAALGIASLRHQQQAIEDEALDHVQRISMLLERELSAQIDILRTLTNSALLDGPVDEAAFAELA